MNPDLAVLLTGVVLAALAIWFAAYCLADIRQARQVRYLSREAWALLCVLTIPLGGMLYLRYGKVR